MMGAVRVLRRVAIGMVHPVEDSIGPGGEVRTPLANPGEDIKELLPELTHLKHLMGRIAV